MPGVRRIVFRSDDPEKFKMSLIVIPAKAGIQFFQSVGPFWTPVFTGVTTCYADINNP